MFLQIICGLVIVSLWYSYDSDLTSLQGLQQIYKMDLRAHVNVQSPFYLKGYMQLA